MNNNDKKYSDDYIQRISDEVYEVITDAFGYDNIDFDLIKEFVRKIAP